MQFINLTEDRTGDAFMTRDGLRVFAVSRVAGKRFVSVHEPQVGPTLKLRLAEFEPPNRLQKNAIDHVKLQAGKKTNVDPVSFGRHESKRAPPPDRLIRASDGRMIRLVGGFAG